MKVKPEEVDYIASLSRLILSQEEKEIYANHLSQILEHAERLKELDTDNVKPTAHVLPMTNVFREDEVKPSLDRGVLLSNAPEVESGCFKVPKIVE
ncbi:MULTISPECIES: Asp-tRNA(Asn)/Glu-tRNA(Gln) amidotransferase subunit GatC [Tepidanaerobacter]|uniref:Aspartyl/glutamyl-tRNA(Asn/Gln) amidotransferase subunit C n=1 Tax=Tepidanaerobacter syntrophicus TaxID=224999 RepID=A0A0U9HRL6_9FIRM|nr:MULTISPECIES: Asp-tRNA(Asn)/Glu-tRNA(Gln) amidotransferase subunit GatC [Tepidanaerobacter]GAQ25671.1 aspartyl-tRNA(Asn)/glutamyl-tRNA(Gln) amidotransferase subunit C [Tepidanaerobacter syntrophicus]GLI20319.1 aspartyl/glutamyl-tRNA(Asn/Gln) amidotransferase subunit C [Tepidanaerobacter syntrophicus]GLI51505.1 aspartyl/glutamyl-tRNA(Asn/Gln) amidotransferase subunit C [Tepidanaerobacter syntrophicus]HHV82437.1 Asp-tRNA(Asn)/Glu-tRNA(Gln) amidotransferase subunit GatC [Tepidanaerobacter syntr